MTVTYYVAEDANDDLYVWREDEGAEEFPQPLVSRRSMDDYLWQKLSEGMERR